MCSRTKIVPNTCDWLVWIKLQNMTYKLLTLQRNERHGVPSVINSLFFTFFQYRGTGIKFSSPCPDLH